MKRRRRRTSKRPLAWPLVSFRVDASPLIGSSRRHYSSPSSSSTLRLQLWPVIHLLLLLLHNFLTSSFAASFDDDGAIMVTGTRDKTRRRKGGRNLNEIIFNYRWPVSDWRESLKTSSAIESRLVGWWTLGCASLRPDQLHSSACTRTRPRLRPWGSGCVASNGVCKWDDIAEKVIIQLPFRIRSFQNHHHIVRLTV